MLYSDTLEWAAQHRGRDTAWIWRDRRRSWAEVDERANRVANALLTAGHAPGQRIAILATNSDQLAEVYFAFSKAGLVAVPLNIRSSPAEIRFIIEQAEVSGFVVSAELIESYRTAAPAEDDFLSVIGLGSDHGLATDYEALVAAGQPHRPPHRVDPDDLRIVKFTSGTTGTPKGCMGTHRECMSNVTAYLIAQPYAPDDVCGLIVSLGSGLASYMLAAHVYRCRPTVILHTTRPGEILDAIADNGITRLTAVPTMIASLVEEQAARPRDLSTLRLIGYTGAPATVDLIARGHEVLGCGFYQSYGATESGGRITYLSPEAHRQIVADAAGQTDAWGRDVMPCGGALPGIGTRLEDESGNPVAAGEVGELVVQGESVFKGYWKQPDLNAEVLNDGWWRTGDLARRDANGNFYIVDRKKDMIVSGGYNVYSIEVEQVLSRHPGISQVAVIGTPDPRWGEAITAFLVATPDFRPEESELEALCRAELAAYKIPKRFVFIDAMPMTTTGKIRKTELREL